MKRLQCLQHVVFETPGEIGNWARERGMEVAVTHVYRGDPLPDPASFDGLILMGGPMNIYQDRGHPWLKAERAFLRRLAREGGKKMLGVCLGAQLLADALGGRVAQNPAIEIGWFPIRRKAPGADFFPEEATVLHWHGDTFELPDGAQWLAESDLCAHQAFLYQDRILGLQFHLEIERVGLAALCGAEAEILSPRPGVQGAEELAAGYGRHADSNRNLLFRLLDRFFLKA